MVWRRRSYLTKLGCEASSVCDHRRVEDQLARRAAYGRTVVEIELPTGERVRTRVDQPLPGPLRRHLPLYVLTAYNPGSKRPGPDEKRQRQWELEERLRRAEAHPVLRALGRDPDGDHEEPSVAVGSVSEARALKLAREYGQDANFALDSSGIRVVDC